MRTNVGPTDRLIRIGLGLPGVVAFSTSGVWTWVAAILAVIALFTATTGFCLLYTLFGVNTCPAPKRLARQ